MSRENIRLGRIAGVRVEINWSVLAIFVLITLGLGAGQFPHSYPGYSTAAYVVAAAAAGVIFLGSLLAHEVSHAVVAQRNGLKVEGITLWLLGGMARIRGEPPGPGAELRIAGVGPAVSMLLAAVFAGITALLAAAGVRGLVLGVFIWLAAINAVLAVFNMIPAAPLDGGRLLHAFLWWRHGDRYAAAVTAARAGRLLGYALIGLGVVELVFLSSFGGVWLALIGLFLIVAASAEEQQSRARQAMTGVRAGDIMSPDPVVVPADLTVAAFVDHYVFGYRHSTFPVVGPDGRPTGMITLSRVKRIPPEQRTRTRVGDVACPLAEVPVADVNEPVADLLPRLSGCADGRALVRRDGVLVGVISPSDITRRLDWARLHVSPAGPDLFVHRR